MMLGPWIHMKLFAGFQNIPKVSVALVTLITSSLEFHESGRLPERIIRTVQRRLDRGEGFHSFSSLYKLTSY